MVTPRPVSLSTHPWIPPVLALACALAGCSKSQGARASGRDEAPRPVTIELVQSATVRRTVEVVGTLAAQEEVTISAETEGTVSQIRADLGDRVQAGQPLVELDREKAGYKLAQQKAALDRALAKYGVSAPGQLPPIEQTPDVQKAAAELAQARQAFERAKALHDRQLLPRQQLDDAEAAQRSKQATYESALQNAKNLRADIDASDAAMRLADRELRDTSIRAPFDGYVQKRIVSLGELVRAQAPVMGLVRVDPLKVIAEVPERMAPWIEVGQAVTLTVDAFPDKTIAGTVSRISPAVNTGTRAFPFEARVPNSGALLKPGTFARVRIDTSKTDTVLTVPVSSLQYRYGVNRVFVLTGDRLMARELRVGDRVGDRIEVVSGVSAGDPVALGDIERFVDGMKALAADAHMSAK
jgi:multidrug efflux pump subunit AcrA (membrane-fusion protein)